MEVRPDLLGHLGAAARELRESAGLTQRELADETGIHQRWISNLECGVRNPSYGSLRRLADGLGVPVSRLVEAAERREAGS